jgi:hypothetical protein
VAAVINITPTILGGRICVFADAIGMSLQSYHFLQQWLARLAVAEVFVHFILHMWQADWTIQSTVGFAVGFAVGLAVRNNEYPFRVPLLTYGRRWFFLSDSLSLDGNSSGEHIG